MEIVKREDIHTETYREIFDAETHHQHEIIRDSVGTLRWKPNATVVELITPQRINLNDLVHLMHTLGYGKNSEFYRKLYRDMGYSLSGYWEIFFWEANNPKASKYKAPNV
jgi:hypothetical protein